jgi:hypothetical protein
MVIDLKLVFQLSLGFYVAVFDVARVNVLEAVQDLHAQVADLGVRYQQTSLFVLFDL